jgi:CheY-like chemotaxis protein
MTKILVVDDNEQNLYLLEVLLKGHGYQVLQAANGAEALELARNAPPGLIIADILMPVMDGFALCREWKSDQQLRVIPFVFYTATYTSPEDEEFALSLGAERFIIKPQEPNVFIAYIEEVLASHETGKLIAKRQPEQAEEIFYKEYNQTLVRKLEDKMLALEVARDNLSRANAHLLTLHQIDEAILNGQPLETIAQIALDRFQEQIPFQRGSVASYDFADGMAQTLATYGPHADGLKQGQAIPLAQFGSLEFLREGETQWIEDTEPLVGQSTGMRALYEQGVRSGMNIPLKVGGEVVGALNIGFETPNAFSPESRHQFQEIADLLAIALHNARLAQEVLVHVDQLEVRVDERTKKLNQTISLMAGREVRMAGLKKAIKKLRSQLKDAGIEPIADDPLSEGFQ